MLSHPTSKQNEKPHSTKKKRTVYDLFVKHKTIKISSCFSSVFPKGRKTNYCDIVKKKISYLWLIILCDSKKNSSTTEEKYVK